MAAFASLPDRPDTPSITYAIPDPVDAIAKLPGIERVPRLQSALEKMAVVPGFSAGVEVPLSTNVGEVLQGTVLKLTLTVPDTRQSLNNSDVEFEIQYSPAAGVSEDGAWSVKVLQNQFENGPGALESVATSVQLDGIETADVARLALAAGRGDLASAVQSLFRNAESATFKVSANHDVDGVADAAARAVGGVLPGVGAFVGGLAGPGGAGVGFRIGAAANTAANVIATTTETSIETGVSTTVVNLDADATIQTADGSRRLGETLVIAHDGGSAIEVPLDRLNLFGAAVDAMRETPVEEAFPTQGRLLDSPRVLANPLELAQFAVTPGYNGGDPEVKFYVDRRQLDLGTSPWDLAVASFGSALYEDHTSPSGYSYGADPRGPLQDEVGLAYGILSVLNDGDRLPTGRRVTDGVIGGTVFTQKDLLVMPGSTETARQMLTELVDDLRRVGDAQSIAHVAERLNVAGAGALRQNFGIPELDAVNNRTHPAAEQTDEEARQADVFNRTTEAPGTIRLLSREWTVVDRGRVQNPPLIGRKTDYDLPERPGVRVDRQVFDAAGDVARDRQFRIGPFRLGDVGREANGRLAGVEAGGVVAAPAGPRSALDGADGWALGERIGALASALAGPAAAGRVADALRSGDPSALAELHPEHGAALAAAVAGVTGNGAPSEAVIAGVEAARSDRTAGHADEPGREPAEPVLAGPSR